MTKKTVWIFLICITLLGAALRLYQFGSIPTGLNRDELALGYNAYSLLKTGQDEWGKSWPVVFRSFGDYKLGGYIYTLIPFIWLFGLTEHAVRTPSLIAGIFLPLIMFYFMRTLTKNVKLSVVSAGVVAILPWAIFYSRVGFEANLALSIFVLAVTFFLKSFTSWKYRVASVLCFFISFLTYNSPLLIMPFILAIFVWAYGKKALPSVVAIAISVVLAVVLVFPTIQGKGTITVFSDVGVLNASQEVYARAGNNPILRVYAKPFVFTMVEIAKKYVTIFSPEFLVQKGGANPWHQPNGAGHISWSMYVFAAIGILSVLFRRKKTELIILAIFLASAIPSSITIDAPHATRSLLFLLLIGVFASIGVRALWRKKRLIGIVAVLLIVLESAVYMQHYMNALTAPHQSQWNQGIENAVKEAEHKHEETRAPIVMLTDPHYAYISTLFYTQYDPATYRDTVEYYIEDNIGLSQVKSYGHYLFVADVRVGPSPSIVISQNEHDGRFEVHENK